MVAQTPHVRLGQCCTVPEPETDELTSQSARDPVSELRLGTTHTPHPHSLIYYPSSWAVRANSST